MIEKFGKNLIVKMTVVFLIAAAVPYILVVALYYKSSKTELTHVITEKLGSDAELLASTVDAKLFLDYANADAWADLDVMKDILADDVDKRISRVITGLRRDYNIAGDVHVINAKGKVVASTSKEFARSAVSGAWVEKVLGGEGVSLPEHVFDVRRSTVAFAEPVKPSIMGGKTIGAVIVERNVKDLLSSVDLNKTHFVALVGKDGKILAISPEDEHSVGAVNDWLKIKGKVVFVQDDIIASAKEAGVYGFKGFGWSVLFAASEEEAMASIHYLARASFFVGLLGLIFITGLVYMFSRSVVTPIVKLSEAAGHIARTKDFSSFVNVHTADEVGRLATSFNHMVAEIKGYIDRIRDMEDDIVRTDRLAALAELSAGMAHEIRNPLGVVKCSAEMLLEKADPKSMEGELIQAIWDESGRLEKLLEAFLQFARPRPPQLSPCAINTEIENTMMLLNPQLRKSRVEASLKLEDGLPSVMSDANQLHQVLINIVINAIQAMPNGGWIKITTEKVRAYRPDNPDVECEAVRICVADTGSGMSDELLKKVFNPFFTTKEKGTGLGLSIVQRIISGLGGWIKINSLPLRGTEFDIYLPV